MRSGHSGRVKVIKNNSGETLTKKPREKSRH